MVKDIPTSGARFEETNFDKYPIVDTTFDFKNIRRLTPSENRELEGALNHLGCVLPESCIGNNGAVQIQEVINKTEVLFW